MSSQLHPAVTISNIRTLIPVTLDIENGHYTTWSELFKIQCKSFQVYDHLQPRVTDTSSSSTTSSDKEKDKEKGQAPNIFRSPAHDYDAWTALANLFQDNKASRTIDLNNRFASTLLDQFPSMTAYCQAMKVIYDQLTNIGSPITDEQLVLQILTGLTEQYESVVLIIQQTKPLPTFYETRSQFCMAETRKINQAKQVAHIAGTALAATADSSSSHKPDTRSESERGRGRGRGRGHERGRNSSSRGRGGWNSSGYTT
ncbi:uncharacterized protein LOC110893457 [Helianthus annuus]|uniref:uncharacterized protein LOC110893457 n=1 Tax=Helianthus annuus TaxID=4232 RepID=UPI000B900D84|nr:uncharacterized protein LOC110893457 [Helianthus annuus]